MRAASYNTLIPGQQQCANNYIAGHGCKQAEINRILFLKFGGFSLINEHIYKILHAGFEGIPIDVIDIKDVWRKKFKFYHYLVNISFFAKEYGKDFIFGDKKLNELFSWFFGTSYMSLLTDKYIRKLVAGKSYQFTFQTQCLFNGKLKGIPHFIYTDHTTKTNLLYPGINPKRYIRSDRFIKKAESKMYLDADMVFTCGSLVSHSLINQYAVPASKTLTVFAGSNIEPLPNENNAKYASKNILFVGVDWERKGGPVLLKIFEKVLLKHPDASLTIVGCDPGKIALPNCKVIGKIAADKLAKFYNEAAVFCLPTLREPFGIVFIEAMHNKLPIVANNIGSISDMVIDDFNGYLIDHDVDKYAHTICKLFDDPQKGKQLGENGFTYAQTKFTWEMVGKTMKEQIVQYL